MTPTPREMWIELSELEFKADDGIVITWWVSINNGQVTMRRLSPRELGGTPPSFISDSSSFYRTSSFTYSALYRITLGKGKPIVDCKQRANYNLVSKLKICCWSIHGGPFFGRHKRHLSEYYRIKFQMIIMMKMTNMVMIMGIILMLMRTTKKTDNYLDYTPFKYYYLVKKDQTIRAGVDPPLP